jgi:hypothetical protein
MDVKTERFDLVRLHWPLYNKNFAAAKPRTINFPHHSLTSIERQNVLAIK